jgi:tetraacyldisaccharide 4'-kinase
VIVNRFNPYALFITLKNLGYRLGIFKQRMGVIPTVVVGNISSGGSGKTPFCAQLIEELVHLGMKPAILTRGYKRKSKGPYWVEADSDYTFSGDEPLWLKQKFPSIPVLCNGDRLEGVATIKQKYPETDCVILDDGFQHRKLRPHVAVVLIPFDQVFEKQRLIPFGFMREPLVAIRRADFVVVTKTPKTSPKVAAIGALEKITTRPVFATALIHDVPAMPNSEVGLITGIADALPLINHLRQTYHLSHRYNYPDHHSFTSEQIDLFKKQVQKGTHFLTTEKDLIRLKAAGFDQALAVKVKHDISPNQLKQIVDRIVSHVEEYRSGSELSEK